MVGLAAWVRKHHPEKGVIVASAERQMAAHELCQELPFLHNPYDFDEVVGPYCIATPHARLVRTGHTLFIIGAPPFPYRSSENAVSR